MRIGISEVRTLCLAQNKGLDSNIMDQACARHLKSATRFTLNTVSEDFEYLCELCGTGLEVSLSFPISHLRTAKAVGVRNYSLLYSRVKKQKDSIDQLRSLNSQQSDIAQAEIANYLRNLSGLVETRKAFFESFLTEIEEENAGLLTRLSNEVSSSSTALLSLLSHSSGSELVKEVYQITQLKAVLEPYFDFMVSTSLKKQELIEKMVKQVSARSGAVRSGSVRPYSFSAPTASSLLPISSSQADTSDTIEDFTDPVPAALPIFLNCDQVKRLDISLKSSSEPFRCTGLESEFAFSEYIAFVITGSYTYFIIGAGVSKRMTAHLSIETGLGIPFPELDKERGSCGLLYYKDEIYLFGGYGRSKYGLTRNLVMNPPFQNTDKISVVSEERKWKGLAEMPTARYGFTPARYRQKVFLVGGWDSAGRVDQYDLKLNRYKTLPMMQGPGRVASSCVCGTTLVTISQGTMWKWNLTSGDGSYSEHEEMTLTESVEDLWSNMIPICLEDKIYYMHIPGSRMIILEPNTGHIDIRRLR